MADALRRARSSLHLTGSALALALVVVLVGVLTLLPAPTLAGAATTGPAAATPGTQTCLPPGADTAPADTGSGSGDPTLSDPSAGSSPGGDGSSSTASFAATEPAGAGTSGSSACPGEPLAPTVPVIHPAHPYRPVRHGISAVPASSGPTVPGSLAQLLPFGRAAAPASAPRAVKVMIWTANRLIGLRYRWGGGHGSFSDRGYDCSGSVSYVLHAANLIASPADSRGLMHWGARGPGSWVTVYARNGHAFMVVAGLRMDTSPAGDPSGLDGPRWRPNLRGVQGYSRRHPAGQL